MNATRAVERGSDDKSVETRPRLIPLSTAAVGPALLRAAEEPSHGVLKSVPPSRYSLVGRVFVQ